MDSNERRVIYTDAITRYGEQHQVVKAVEELSELTKELMKFLGWCMDGTFVNNTELRDRSKCMITGEMADVYVVLEQLKMIFDNSKAVEAVIDGKTARLKSRMEGKT